MEGNWNSMFIFILRPTLAASIFSTQKTIKKLTLELNMGEIWPPNQLRGHLPVVYSPEDLVTVQIGDDIVIIPEPEFGGSKLGCPVPVYF